VFKVEVVKDLELDEWGINLLKIWRSGKSPVDWLWAYMRFLRIAGTLALGIRYVDPRFLSLPILALLNSLRC